MNIKKMIYLVAFFIFMGPKPTNIVFFNNKIFIAFAPLFVLLVLWYCYKEEIRKYNFNDIKNREFFSIFINCLQFSIYSQALTSIILGQSAGAYDSILQTYLIMPLYAIMVAPLAEEIVYRKIIFKYLDKHLNFWLSASISSVIFAIGHFSLNRFLGYFLTGMIFCYYYKKSRSIVPLIAAHSAINFISIFVATIKS
ncbi:CPBP family intramembrane glutamic endopeptidase [Paenibacillus cremeus]|uniref:CPBP family intramembrane metalloprotease n=1 Tax=Paenibacillus cremeus TaxID=2163881 RepID=A0A559K3H5_9BACL|nr:type II CAAX endopeptidase family protein [Paenibacillus cremeus]TVY06693.1 CPBP family intramembrane metalloprotease [Paenibacillus cremeus]